mmetsp:Transcript_8517/g.17241  ORF Transcript_8517/g.17241 Transcript_8517/m.17241 type:complete len:105 (-) Transcript_8517:465-779(-)
MEDCAWKRESASFKLIFGSSGTSPAGKLSPGIIDDVEDAIDAEAVREAREPDFLEETESFDEIDAAVVGFDTDGTSSGKMRGFGDFLALPAFSSSESSEEMSSS